MIRYTDDPWEDELSGPKRPKWSIPVTEEEKELLALSARKFWPQNDRFRHDLIMIIKALTPIEAGSADNPVQWPREWWDQNMTWAKQQKYLPIKAVHTLMTNTERLNSFRSRWYATQDKTTVVVIFDEKDGGAYL